MIAFALLFFLLVNPHVNVFRCFLQNALHLRIVYDTKFIRSQLWNRGLHHAQTNLLDYLNKKTKEFEITPEEKEDHFTPAPLGSKYIRAVLLPIYGNFIPSANLQDAESYLVTDRLYVHQAALLISVQGKLLWKSDMHPWSTMTETIVAKHATAISGVLQKLKLAVADNFDDLGSNHGMNLGVLPPFKMIGNDTVLCPVPYSTNDHQIVHAFRSAMEFVGYVFLRTKLLWNGYTLKQLGPSLDATLWFANTTFKLDSPVNSDLNFRAFDSMIQCLSSATVPVCPKNSPYLDRRKYLEEELPKIKQTIQNCNPEQETHYESQWETLSKQDFNKKDFDDDLSIGLCPRERGLQKQLLSKSKKKRKATLVSSETGDESSGE